MDVRGDRLGYMSQDSVNLAVLEATGDDKERARAGKVLGLLKKGQHWVLGMFLRSLTRGDCSGVA